MLLALFLSLWPYTSQMLCRALKRPPWLPSPQGYQENWQQRMCSLGLGGRTWSVLRQYLVQGWHGSVLEETLEKVPSAQGSQGDDIRSMALAEEEQRWQEGQQGLWGLRA